VTPDTITARFPLGRLLVVLVFAALGAALLWRSWQRPAILVIQSSTHEVPWVRGIDAGLHRAFDAVGGLRARWFYLDHDDDRVDDRFQIRRLQQAHGLIDSWKPDVVVAVDAAAQTLVASRPADPSGPFIVYSGIESAGGQLASSTAAQVSGISERTPWPAIQTLLREIAIRRGLARPRIAIIAGPGDAAHEEITGFRTYDWGDWPVAGVWRSATLAEWEAQLEEVRRQADLVIVGDYRSLPRPFGWDRRRLRKAVVQRTLHALPQPLLALSVYAVRDGIPVSILPSPFEQGYEAAHMAVARTRGDTPADLHLSTRHFVVYTDEQELAARGIVLPPLYASYARAARTILTDGTP
jgi:hypothetical protein